MKKQMVNRFEIVQQPVEQRVHDGIRTQANSTVNAALKAFAYVEAAAMATVNSSFGAFDDEVLVSALVSKAMALLRPDSFPGFLLFAGILILILHWVALSVVSHRFVYKGANVNRK